MAKTCAFLMLIRLVLVFPTRRNNFSINPIINEQMKTTLMALLLPFFCLTAMADEPKTQLVVWAKDGTKVAYALAEKPKVTFTETDLVITAKGVEVNYSLENMARFTYESSENSAIRNLKTDEVSFKLDGESLLFPSLSANSKVSLHSLNGTLVFSKTVRTAGEYSFPLSGLNTGIYMVTVNGLTYKIVKR